MKQIIANYSFDKTAKTVTFTDFGTIRLDRILLITNVTANAVIYQFNNPALGGTVSGNVLTLTYNTTSMNNADKLQIIYNTLSSDPTYETLSTQGVTAEATGLSAGSLNADLLPSTDVRAYKWYSVQITGTFSGTLTFQTSNDNTNWVVTSVQSSALNNAQASNTTTGAGIFFGSVNARYLRVRMTSYTSGTANGVVQFFSSAGVFHTQGVFAGQNGTWNVGSSSATGSVAPTNAFYVGVKDGSGNLQGANSIGANLDGIGASNTLAAGLMVYNGSNYDRVRSANAATGTTGTGLQGAAALGFDGTNYQRLRVDTNGNQTLGASTTGGYTPNKIISTSSTNATSIKASAGTIGYLTASNTNASPRYLKIYDKASAPTVGSDSPIHTFIIPGSASGAGTNIPLPPQGISCVNGIAIALTTGVVDSDTGAVGANEIVVNYGYK